MIKSLALSLAVLLAGTLSALASSTGGAPNSISAPGTCLTASTGGGSSPVVTLGLSQVNQYKISGSSYTALTADACLITGVGNASAFTLTVPQAGSTGFGAGWGATYLNVGTANVTVNTTTSVFKGAAGGTSYTLIPGGWIQLTSDGTNWPSLVGNNVPLSYSVQYIAGQNPNNAVLVAHLPQPILITSMVGRPSAATGATATASLFAAPSGTACASGLALTGTTNFNANGTAATDQVLAGTNTQIPAGDSLCLQTTGTWTSGAGAITVYAVPGPTPSGGPITLVHAGSASQNGGSSTTQSLTLPNATTIGNGEVVGILWCVTGTACNAGPATGDLVSSVTVGSNTCAEAPGAFHATSTGFFYMTTVYVCPNMSSGGATTVTVNTSSAVEFLTVIASEWNCPTSHCTVDGSIANGGDTANSGTSLSISTSGNTTQAGELIYSIGSGVGAGGLTAGDTLINTLSSFAKDEYQLSGASGTTYADRWTDSPTGMINGSVAAIKP